MKEANRRLKAYKFGDILFVISMKISDTWKLFDIRTNI